jgi:hypothetical protein
MSWGFQLSGTAHRPRQSFYQNISQHDTHREIKITGDFRSMKNLSAKRMRRGIHNVPSSMNFY